jgi:hypothetical protein
MKTLPFVVLTASLAVNAVFAFLLLRGSKDTAATAAVSPSAQTALAAKSAASAPSSATDAATWTKLQTAELPALVSRLRDSGFPPEVVRAIVMAQLSESFAARSRALNPDAAKRPFWKNVQQTDPQIQAAQRQLSREYEQAMRAVLGEDYESSDPLSQLSRQRQFGGIPPEKMSEVRQIIREFSEKQSALVPGGTLVASDIEKLDALHREQQAAILAVLTPEERAEYLIRSSQTAQSLRSRLAFFEPTEQEYRSIFQLQYAYDETYPNVRIRGQATAEQQEQMRQRSEAQKLLTEQIKAALGPARAEEYTRAIDFSYQQAARLVARLELPPANAVQIYNTQKEIQERMTKLRSLPPAERNPQFTALEAEANARLGSLLGGARGVEAYKQNGGQWLQNIVPRPAPAPTLTR